jgi:hypothetical protein
MGIVRYIRLLQGVRLCLCMHTCGASMTYLCYWELTLR